MIVGKVIGNVLGVESKNGPTPLGSFRTTNDALPSVLTKLEKTPTSICVGGTWN